MSNVSLFLQQRNYRIADNGCWVSWFVSTEMLFIKFAVRQMALTIIFSIIGYILKLVHAAVQHVIVL